MTDTSNPAPRAEGQPWTLYVGDARAVLAGMPDQSVNCIVTSPPDFARLAAERLAQALADWGEEPR